MQCSKAEDQGQEILALSYQKGQKSLYIDKDLGSDQFKVRGHEITLRVLTFALQNIVCTE